VALSIPVMWSDAHRLHAPETGVWAGVAIDADEFPASADCIREVLEEAGASVVDAEPHADDALLAVHDSGLVEFLPTAWSNWAAGSGADVWLAGVDRLIQAAPGHRCDALVVALGVDAGTDDPNSPLAVTEVGFREAGRRLGALGLPTVLVQEGGYVLETVGTLVRAVLEGLDETR
jgi:acetoin utilization deacetylase AcuC-like enzyme